MKTLAFSCHYLEKQQEIKRDGENERWNRERELWMLIAGTGRRSKVVSVGIVSFRTCRSSARPVYIELDQTLFLGTSLVASASSPMSQSSRAFQFFPFCLVVFSLLLFLPFKFIPNWTLILSSLFYSFISLSLVDWSFIFGAPSFCTAIGSRGSLVEELKCQSRN